MVPEAARGRGHQLTGSTGYFLELGAGGVPADASLVRCGRWLFRACESALA